MSISTSSVKLVAASVSPLAEDRTTVQTVSGNVSVAAAGNTDSADKTKAKELTAVTPEQIRQSLDDINVMLNARSVSVQFQIDPGYKDAILQVVDQHSGKVLLQLPSVEAVRIAKMTEQMKGVLIAQKV